MSGESKIYELVHIHVAPAHIAHFEPELKKKVAFMKKHGYQICNVFRYNVEQKGTLVKSLLADQEFLKFDEGYMKMVNCITSVILKSLPFCKITKPSNPKNCLSLRRYTVKGDPYKAVADFKGCLDVIYEKHIVPRGLTMIGGFLAVFGDSTNAYYAMWDLNGPDAIHRVEEVGKAILADESAACPTQKMWDHVISVSSKVYTPLIE